MMELALAGVLMFGAAGVPGGFLPIESKELPSGWTASVQVSRGGALLINPCERDRAADGGRVEQRSVFHYGEEQGEYQQLVVYKDALSAHRAMNGLRRDLARCGGPGQGWDRYNRTFVKPLDLGDEGLRAGQRYFEGGSHTVAVRRGSALFIAGETAWPTRSLPINRFRDLTGQAEELLTKVCDLPEVTC
ncbi:MAG: hypothetical protein HOY71_55250 [Nonomuraea sp.]|nr:hypothetical protein [Nonomuraea sp.]